MKLTDFSLFDPLETLRKKMGAEFSDHGVGRNWESLDIEKIREQLSKKEGIEVELEEIAICADGTFEFKGQKVLVYIRDQYFNPNYPVSIVTFCSFVQY